MELKSLHNHAYTFGKEMAGCLKIGKLEPISSIQYSIVKIVYKHHNS